MTTCRGMDVSAYQGAQDWTARKAEGVVFAFAKASEGQTSRDPRFATHITGIKAAGLIPGAYHFAWPNQDPQREAANYIAAVKGYAGAGFTHWLDLERYSDGRNYSGRTAAQILAWVKTWLSIVEAAFPGQRVGIYTSSDDLAAGHVPAGVPLWYPAYPWGPAAYSKAEAAGQPKPSGRSPLIWQFTSQPVDRSIAYLSAAEFRAWAAGTTQEEDVPLSKTDVTTLAHTDDVFVSPDGDKDPKGNAFWTLESYQRYGYLQDRETNQLVKSLVTKLDAQTAAIAKLASLVGSEVDTAEVVAAVQKAIADAVVKVSVDVTGPSAS